MPLSKVDTEGSATNHLEAVLAAAGSLEMMLLTHHHRDHTGAVEEWVEMPRSPVRGAGHGTPVEDGE